MGISEARPGTIKANGLDASDRNMILPGASAQND
jgi:hypothetical protein